MSNRDLVINQRFVIKNPPLLKCYCNDGGNCFKNKTCETEGFCYQRLTIQNKNGMSTKKMIKGCSSSKQIDFYYCTRSSNTTNLKCCSNNFCNNQQMDIPYYSTRKVLNFTFFMFLVIIVTILLTLIIKKFNRRRQVKDKKIDTENANGSNKPKLENQIEFLNLIKRGKFVQSFCGRRLGEELFVKKFKEKLKENWLNEVEVYSLPLIRHESIADFVGKDYLLIATIYYRIGSLTNYLIDNRNLNEDQMLKLMLSAAQGLDHLHQDLEFKPSIVHRNLNSNNFVVMADQNTLRCKLTDFSNALTYTRYENLEKEQKLKQLKTIVCDLQYCPPEYFNQKINYRNFLAFQAADTYSFSLILWQIANHQADEQASNHSEQSTLSQDQFRQSIQSNAFELSAKTNTPITDQGNLTDFTNLDRQDDQKETQNEQVHTQDRSIEREISDEPESNDQVDTQKDDDTLCQINSIRDQINSSESRYCKPYEEYLMHDTKKTKYIRMKELLIDDSVITRPTICFDATKVRTFNGHVIPKLIDESWSFDPSARLSIARIVKDLTQQYNIHLKNMNKK